MAKEFLMLYNKEKSDGGVDAMNMKATTVKYSIFGRYDLIDNTPENVSKLYDNFGQEGFMPNMVTLLKIEQPQNTVDQLIRPQLVNKSMPCTITILPERVDIEMINVKLNIIYEYFERLIKIFDLKINRIALNTTTLLENLTEDEAKKLKDKLAPPENYCGEENLIEYASHRVARKKVECLGELINVGRNITGLSSIEDGDVAIRQVQIDTDINTLGELLKERFNIKNCSDFFEVAVKCNQEVLDNMERIIHAD